jgi:magnesium transporter
MQITYYTHHEIREATVDDLPALLQSDEGAIWVDMPAPTDDDLALLSQLFELHPLAIEDIRNQKQRPKAEEFADYLFIILNPITRENEWAGFQELDVLVGRNYVVSVHLEKEPVIDAARRRIDPLRVPFPISATYLLYILFDTVIDDYFPVLEAIENEIEALGNQLLDQANPDMVNRLFQLKQSLNDIWRVVWPHRDIVNVLMNHELVFIDRKSQYYLRDISDHLARLADMAQSARDTIPSLISLYMSAVSNRLNYAVNRLTVFTIAIGILAVVVGFYGMNFQHTWPPFHWEHGIPIVLLLIIVLSVSILAIFRWRRWVG